MWNRPQSTRSQPEAPAQARLDTSLEASHQAKTGGGGTVSPGSTPQERNDCSSSPRAPSGPPRKRFEGFPRPFVYHPLRRALFLAVLFNFRDEAGVGSHDEPVGIGRTVGQCVHRHGLDNQRPDKSKAGPTSTAPIVQRSRYNSTPKRSTVCSYSPRRPQHAIYLRTSLCISARQWARRRAEHVNASPPPAPSIHPTVSRRPAPPLGYLRFIQHRHPEGTACLLQPHPIPPHLAKRQMPKLKSSTLPCHCL